LGGIGENPDTSPGPLGETCEMCARVVRALPADPKWVNLYDRYFTKINNSITLDAVNKGKIHKLLAQVLLDLQNRLKDKTEGERVQIKKEFFTDELYESLKKKIIAIEKEAILAEELKTITELRQRIADLTVELESTKEQEGQLRATIGPLLAQIETLEASFGGESAEIGKELNSIIAGNSTVEEKQKAIDAVLHQMDQRFKDRFEQLNQKIYIDALTGMNNRRKYDEDIAEKIKNREENQTAFALVLVDIDHFKKFNDTYGHKVGDQVLAIVAKELRNNLKGKDGVYRYGGEEFTVILNESDPTKIMAATENLRRAVHDHEIVAKGQQVKITISLGISLVQAGDSSETIFERADRALYAAKDRGRNQAVSFTDLTAAEIQASQKKQQP
jgi:diguanylate cyclase (GGDEF)-like protein